MKKLFVFVFLFLSFGILINAQYNKNNNNNNDDNYIKIPKNELPKEFVQKYELQQLMDKYESVGQMIAIGKAVGIAINEGLSAVVNNADKFGNTNVGKYTMFLIAFNVMGDKIIKIFFGPILFLLCAFILGTFQRRMIVGKKVLIEKTGFMGLQGKKYELRKPLTSDFNSEGMGLTLFFFGLMWAALIGTFLSIIFS